jgi:hypothetical protein
MSMSMQQRKSGTRSRVVTHGTTDMPAIENPARGLGISNTRICDPGRQPMTIEPSQCLICAEKLHIKGSEPTRDIYPIRHQHGIVGVTPNFPSHNGLVTSLRETRQNINQDIEIIMSNTAPQVKPRIRLYKVQ